MAAFGSNPTQEKGLPSSSAYPPENLAGQGRYEILLVEDNKADVFLIRETVATACPQALLHVVHDGEQAVKFFDLADGDPSVSTPDLVILDINLPKRPGPEVLRHIRKSARCAQAPVLVVTSSDSQKDRDEMARLQVSGYFRKPSDYDEFRKLGDLVRGLLSQA